MVSRLFILSCCLVLASTTTASPVLDFCEQAYKACDFRFLEDDEVFFPYGISNDQVDKAFTTNLVSRVPGEFLGNANVNNITPEFVFQNSARPISDFGAPRFAPTHFKTFVLMGEEAELFGSWPGIGHQYFTGNQLSTADGKCLRVYITDYELLDSERGNVVGHRNQVPKSENKCVVLQLRSV